MSKEYRCVIFPYYYYYLQNFWFRLVLKIMIRHWTKFQEITIQVVTFDGTEWSAFEIMFVQSKKEKTIQSRYIYTCLFDPN